MADDRYKNSLEPGGEVVPDPSFTALRTQIEQERARRAAAIAA